MSNYVLSFRGQSDRKVGADEEAAWGQWFQEISSSIVDFGSRVGEVRVLGAAAKAKGEQLTGYVVITAPSLEGAAALAKGCPGLANDGSVEVGETVEM